MKKVLFSATVDSHILCFHLPYLKYFKEQGYEVHVATNSDEKIPYCDKKHNISFERNPFKLNNLKAIKNLKKIINKEKFDIIHTHTPMGSVVTRLAARNSRKKYDTRVIYTAHGFHFYKGAPLKYWLMFYPVEKFLARYTDDLITINKEDYNRASRKFKTRVHYIPGVGIDPKKFDVKMSDSEKLDLRKSLGLAKNDFVLIYPAEISKRKNQEWLVKSLSSLIKQNNDIHLLLPGIDSLNGKINELVKNLNLEKNINLLGFRNDIPNLLKISNLAISSSRQEGLPVNIIEAMYMGLPIVATSCRGNNDLIEDGKNGYIVSQNDTEQFVDKIKKFYMQEIDIDIFKKNNIKKVKKYLLSDILKEYIKIYNSK